MTTDGPAVPDARVERNIRDLVRWRLIFVLLLFIVPTGLFALFERQARRLDALGDHGQVALATVTGVSQQGAGTYVSYEYTIGGASYTWSVGKDDAPYAMGEKFSVIYVPEDPALSRPGVDRSRATAEAASNRSFARKVVAGFAIFFAVSAFACDFSLRRLRRRGLAELTDPRAYRGRLMFAGAILLSFSLLIFGGHWRDAVRRGESAWPIVLSAVLLLALIGGAGAYVLRHGQAQAAARSARLVRWIASLAAGVAALRWLGWLLGWY